MIRRFVDRAAIFLNATCVAIKLIKGVGPLSLAVYRLVKCALPADPRHQVCRGQSSFIV